MNKLIVIIAIICLTIACSTTKNNTEIKNSFTQTDNNKYRIMFYNAENLFDLENDPNKNDDEFTPDGARHWTENKYKQKLSNLYKVFVAIGEWELPNIIALSEIENRKVLEDLINKTPLYKSDYKIIHYDSPDARGIDVALLYRNKTFKPIKSIPFHVKWTSDIGTGTTRDILYVLGTTNKNDSLHIFVNHWPSRWGGQIETENKRIFVAKLLKEKTDSIFRNDKNAKIIIMGDLNDYPTDRSITEALKANTNFENIKNNKLYNLSYYLQETKKIGTHKHEGKWGILDQIIVSGALLDTTKQIYSTLNDVHVFNADFLLEPDEKYTGQTVKRTFIGFKYHGGYSDHLPTYIDLITK